MMAVVIVVLWNDLAFSDFSVRLLELKKEKHRSPAFYGVALR